MYHPLYKCLLTLCCARFIFQCFIVCRCCECSFFIGCLQIIVCIVFRALSSAHVLLQAFRTLFIIGYYRFRCRVLL